MQDHIRNRMAGHGILMIFCTLLFGMFYWMYIVGGFEIGPGFYILEFQLPGTEKGWSNAHVGPALNGMMVIAVAFVLPLLNFAEAKAKLLAFFIVGDGWGNVAFYFFGNFSGNRALTFGDSRLGEGDIFSFLGLAPAALFAPFAMYALIVIGLRAAKLGSSKRTDASGAVRAPSTST
ncbi:MAG: hypothetical protein CMP06_01245 [Xanthomonadales bacterium]|nr:hypothetical protein [Xanthomonadales bacterium]